MIKESGHTKVVHPHHGFENGDVARGSEPVESIVPYPRFRHCAAGKAQFYGTATAGNPDRSLRADG